MSLIGEMHYLTIGDKTYSVAASITIDNAISPAIAGSAVTGTSTIYNSTNVPSSSAVVDYVEGRGFISGDIVRSVNGQTGNVTIDSPTKLSQLTNDVGYVITDNKLQWSITTTSNTYYPLISSLPSTTSTANTISSINFYQRYNTSGGYRQLRLGNSTNYTSGGGAYGSIRLWGTGSYYGELNPGTIGANSLTNNCTWTLPDKTGIIALTSDIVANTDTTYTLSNALSSHKFTSTLTAGGSGSGTSTATMEFVAGTGITLTDDTTNKKITIASSVTAPTITLNGSTTTSPSFYAPTSAGTDGYVLKSNGSGAPTWTSATLTDTKVTSDTVTAATTNYIVGTTSTSTSITGSLSKHNSASIYTTADSGTGGYTRLQLGNTTVTSSAGGKEGQIRFYGTTATYYVDLKGGAPSSNRTITLPNATGTVALTSDIPSRGTATSGGTTLSVVNTGDMYTWNSKTQAQIVRW